MRFRDWRFDSLVMGDAGLGIDAQVVQELEILLLDVLGGVRRNTLIREDPVAVARETRGAAASERTRRPVAEPHQQQHAVLVEAPARPLEENGAAVRRDVGRAARRAARQRVRAAVIQGDLDDHLRTAAGHGVT